MTFRKIKREYKFHFIRNHSSVAFQSSINMEKIKENLKNQIPTFVANKLFVIDYKVLALVGFTPENMANFRLLIIVFLNFSLEIIPEFYFILHNINDVRAVFMCLHEFVSFLVFVLKVCIMFCNRHRMVSLVTELKNEWEKCE